MSLFTGNERMLSPCQYLERRLATLYGINCLAIKVLDLVKLEMCVEKGFKRDNGTDYYNHIVLKLLIP